MAAKGKKLSKAKQKKAIGSPRRKKLPGEGYKTQRPASRDNNIRNWRVFNGIKTQGELAELSGIARPQISNLESGLQKYNQEHLETLAAVLKCTPADLIDTNPFKAGDIFKIYKRLPPERQQAVDALIKSFAPTNTPADQDA